MRGLRWCLLWLLALVVRAWCRTLRFTEDAKTRRVLAADSGPVAVTLWHNRLFVSSEIFRRHLRHRRIHGLVSASKDGAWLAAFYRLIGLRPVRGSSSNFGREAARQLIDVIREGHDVGITPDGPRGPVYSVEPGVLVVTRRTGAPMLLLGVEFTRAWRLGSWDRFYIPHPFSRITLRADFLPAQNDDGSKLTAEALRAALLALNPDMPERDRSTEARRPTVV